MSSLYMLLGVSGGPLQAVNTEIAPFGSRTTIPSSGYNGFPGMILDDDLLTLRLFYRYGSAHNSPAGEIDARISNDLGVTWPSSGTMIDLATAPNDLRDPCILRLASDRFVYGFDHRTPYDSSNIVAYTRTSDSDIASFSLPWAPLPDGLTGAEESVVSSQPIQLPGGDVLMPGYGYNTAENERCLLWVSHDEGDTWDSPITIAYSVSRDYQEPQIRRLSSGRIVCLMRSESNHHTWRCFSDDDGATWSSPTDVNAMTARPDFVEYRPGRLVQFGRYLTSGDSPGYYAVSFDEGATWTTPLEIDSGETDLWMYGAPVAVSPGVVVMAYCLEESAGSSLLYFRTFSDA